MEGGGGDVVRTLPRRIWTARLGDQSTAFLQ